jgi:hypothetical protein
MAFTRENLSTSRGGNRIDGIHVGIVKKNDDPQMMGRCSVWIPELGGDPADQTSWYIVKYASPFAGVSNPHGRRKDAETMEGAQTAYGFWMQPPDLENQVLVLFANGDPARGYWFACPFSQNMNHSIPGLASNVSTDKSLTDQGIYPPVVEYNKWGEKNPDQPHRPTFDPLHQGLTRQGLYPDSERGRSSSSARREAPSRVLGFSTPRGTVMHVDDNPKNEFIRMRTRGGTQVLVHETSGYVYINSKNGNSWIEISDEGVDIYSKKSVSIRAEEDLNLIADRDVIIEGGRGLFLKAGQMLTAESGQNTHMKAGTDLKIGAGGKITAKAASDYLVSTGGNLRTDSASQTTIKAATFEVGAGTATLHGSAPSSGAATPEVRKAGDRIDIQNGKQTHKKTIVARMPTHEPWPWHPKEGLESGTDTVPDDEKKQAILRAAARPGQGSATGTPTDDPGTQTIQTGTGAVQRAPPIPNADLHQIGRQMVGGNVIAALREASSVSGVDVGYLATKASEVGFNPNALLNGARGIMQLSGSQFTAMASQFGAKFGITTNDIRDPRANAIIGALMTQDNAIYLADKGVSSGPAELSMAHLMGAPTAAQFLTNMMRDPTMEAAAHVSEGFVRSHRSLFYAQDGRARTLEEVHQTFDSRMTGRAAALKAEVEALTTASVIPPFPPDTFA